MLFSTMNSGTTGYDPQTLVKEAVEAHGGAPLWSTLEAVEADISAWGLLFSMKRQPVLYDTRGRASTREARFAFLDFPNPGQRGELIGDAEARIVDEDSTVLSSRSRPGSAFRSLRRHLYWDTLDFIYFAGCAAWNYLLTPFIFLREGFTFETLPLPPGMDPSWAGLRATFPDDIPTHSRTQDFYFDADRYLRRLDYTAEVVGGWARAAHLCDGYKDFNGIRVATRRRVRPLFFGSNPLPHPTLVALEIHGVKLLRGTPGQCPESVTE